jgi:hypothetical protein
LYTCRAAVKKEPKGIIIPPYLLLHHFLIATPL